MTIYKIETLTKDDRVKRLCYKGSSERERLVEGIRNQSKIFVLEFLLLLLCFILDWNMFVRNWNDAGEHISNVCLNRKKKQVVSINKPM